MKTDIISLYFTRAPTLIGALIRFVTWGHWSHVAIQPGIGGRIYEADWDGVISTDFDVWQCTHHKVEADRVQIVVTSQDVQLVRESLESHLDDKYDYGALLGFLLRTKKLNANGKYFCSELAHEVLLDVGVRIVPPNRTWRITPTELYVAARAFVAGTEYDQLCLY